MKHLKWSNLISSILKFERYPTRTTIIIFIFILSADEDKNFGGNLDRLNTRAILYYTGEIKWLAPIIFKSQCAIDVTYFPFDTQRCQLKFGSWTYDTSRLNLSIQYTFNSDDSVDICKFIKVFLIYYFFVTKHSL